MSSISSGACGKFRMKGRDGDITRLLCDRKTNARCCRPDLSKEERKRRLAREIMLALERAKEIK